MLKELATVRVIKDTENYNDIINLLEENGYTIIEKFDDCIEAEYGIAERKEEFITIAKPS